MRRTIAIILAFIMLLSGCSQKASEKQDLNTESNSNSISTEDSSLLVRNCIALGDLAYGH